MLKFIFFAILLSACSFSSSEKITSTNSSVEYNSATADLDGDLFNGAQELERGTNPLIADIPELEVKFFNGHKISIDFTIGNEMVNASLNLEDENKDYVFVEEKESYFKFEIDISGYAQNASTPVLLGENFSHRKNLGHAAKIGKFSGHTWDQISEYDFTWVSHPPLSPKFFFEKSLASQGYFYLENAKSEITITFKISIKLRKNIAFGHIKNLSLNFRYYDYERNIYSLLSNVKMDHHIHQGTHETLKVTIENIPASFISENYLKKGEFLIAEVADFDIPELNTTYKALLSRVRSKAIPVAINTSQQSSVKYVALPKGKARFFNILESLFKDDYLIEENILRKIGQFENNLPNYDYLDEVKGQDKKGKWFVFTNLISGHYLDHHYTPSDILFLTYATGQDLASQVARQDFAHHHAKSSGSEIYHLGKASANSTIHIQMAPHMRWGEKKRTERKVITGPDTKRPEAVNEDFRCHVYINYFDEIYEPLKFSTDLGHIVHGAGEKTSPLEDELLEYFSHIKLIIGEEEFSFKELVSEDKAFVEIVGEKNIHFTISNLSKITEIKESEEKRIAIRLDRIRKIAHSGMKFVNMEGISRSFCPLVVLDMASRWGIPFSVDSIAQDQWDKWTRSWGIVPKEDRIYHQFFSVGIKSIIANRHN